MSKQIIVELKTGFYSNDLDHESIDDYDEANKKLYDVVTFYKNKITQYYENKSWDKYKKLSNEYELIFTSPNANYNVSKYSPVSRSFFKLWEILHDFNIDLGSDGPINCLFLAEGPGGFVEAMIKYRHDYFKELCNDDKYWGMTLKSSNKSVPDWKYKSSNFSVLFGKDGTGNIYNIENIDSLATTLQPHSMDFITADGGFDFSSDFNGQEEMSLRLLTCEICAALKLQKTGGTFIIKVFDMFTPFSLQLINAICSCYEKATLIKPLTSRPANSEKYLLCQGFKPNPLLEQSISNIVSGTWPFEEIGCHVPYFPYIPIDENVKKNLVMFNMFYISRQVLYIQKTINYIKQFLHSGENFNIKKILDDHIEKVKKWCTKYNIPS